MMWRANNPQHEGYKTKDKGVIFGSEQEREKGVHSSRPDENKGFCTKCGCETIHLKNYLCRKCRKVCTDCGREDCPPEELQQYARNSMEVLCPDCFVCRLY